MAAAAGCLLSKDQLLCSICRDVFTDPVSTPCGHNFCKDCITETVDVDVPFQCPVCMKMFYPKPELQVNTLISQMVGAFRRSEQRPARQEEGLRVLGFKPMVLLLCLVCVSFVWDFMKSNQPLEEVSKGEKLKRMEAEIQQTIEEMQLKIEELKRSVELSGEDADREVADGVQVFAALKSSAKRGEAKLLETIREKQRRTELQAEGFIKKLQQDIRELKKRKTDVELLSVIELNETLPEEKIEKLQLLLFNIANLWRAQSYAVDVTLDPDTANQYLVLSDDNKEVYRSYLMVSRPYNPKRFYYNAAILGQQSFSSGKFYFEVQIIGKTRWDLGVARRSINRRDDITPSPANGFWTVGLRNGNEYKAGPGVRLHLQSAPEKVGVFVDYEEGLVSFYDVEAAALIYSLTQCSFTEELYPYFSPSYGSFATLIITPID
ncbi:E3 ubiquitin-protein ligase TRIM21-like [Archocentrus centrarchus]|uniref:E3 ubiquitin-protein ligase TRIM21-like n=1 Tax=Archocentrus centrarchus TaxID=63155 RepID=UPI0011EA3F4B|nr:E3 ubiquitin-protein ligase TRIM21-like [Archocentrus centrarchus]